MTGLESAPSVEVPAPACEVVDVSKRFGATIAVDRASFACAAGEVHALLGENGAGKSTLMKILSGILRPDEGAVRVNGGQVRLDSPRAAFAAGIATAYQELTIERNLSVAENLLLGRAPAKRGFVAFRRLRVEAERILSDWGLDDIDPRQNAGSLSLAARQRLEIVRALSREPTILILDEPTSALSIDDVEWLFARIREIRHRGAAVVYISHRMSEVNEISDRATVLRNGRNVATFDTGTRSHAEIMELMLGRSLAERRQRTAQAARDAKQHVVLTVEELASGGDLHSASFELRRGEILGVAGLEAQGQRSLFMSLFGAQPVEAGRIYIDGRPLRARSPRDAIRAGISLVPEDRQGEGLLLGLSIAANVSLPSLRRYATAGIIHSRRERRSVRRVLEPLRVSQRALDSEAASLSGGNQQKLVVAKWLLAQSRIMLMYDATRGVDVGTKSEIFALARNFANEGGAMLFYSTEVEELVDISDRIAVLYRGEVRVILDPPAISEERVLAEMFGEGGDAAAA